MRLRRHGWEEPIPCGVVSVGQGGGVGNEGGHTLLIVTAPLHHMWCFYTMSINFLGEILKTESKEPLNTWRQATGGLQESGVICHPINLRQCGRSAGCGSAGPGPRFLHV